MKHLMSGNEATARGVYEAGIKVCSAYPGTPSTEILENLPQYGKDVYCEWAPNEKVATEVAYGASVAGSRAFCTMKMVGLNVAADPLFTAGYMGGNGAYVVVTADDPSCHSSQNEQDNRHYARAAKIAMVEPSDAQECKDFVRLACEISEEFDTPVLYRTTTRVCHSKGLVEFGDRVEHTAPAYARNTRKYVCAPANAYLNHPIVEERLAKLAEYGCTRALENGLNKLELGDGYGMRGASALGKEWYEHSAGYCSYLKGKTEAEAASIPADGSDPDLAALCTISIDALQKAVGDAFENGSL